MSDQTFLFIAIGVALVFFLWGRIRYDLVALLTLLVLVVGGLVPTGSAFSGFGHPAVITVAAVLVIGRSLANSGVSEFISKRLGRLGDDRFVQIFALTCLTVTLSAFMNNVGALALLIPVATETARRTGLSPSRLLMPMAFGSLLGGLITVIGTPPNIVIATFRTQTGADPFRMFDFAPVGLAVAAAGVAFIVLVGWRLLPRRRTRPLDPRDFGTHEYVAEVVVPEGARMAGRLVGEIKNAIDADFEMVRLIRDQRQFEAPSTLQEVRADDVLLVRADPRVLEELIGLTGFQMAGSAGHDQPPPERGEVVVLEAVVAPDSELAGRTSSEVNLLGEYGINLLAVARGGETIRERLGDLYLAVGDVLLLQGRSESLDEGLRRLGGLPLVERNLRLGRRRPKPLIAVGIFGAAIGLTATGVLAVEVAFLGAAILMAVAGSLSLREAYESIDWPILILLAAMIPIGEAMVSTGGSLVIADALNVGAGNVPNFLILAIVLVVTMVLTGIVNNTAAAVVMAPIAIDVASSLGASSDPFLMAVAVGASASFLTPIGHQSSILVMGPGGYRFTDYWRMGLPLSILVAVVAVPVITLVWPLGIP